MPHMFRGSPYYSDFQLTGRPGRELMLEQPIALSLAISVASAGPEACLSMQIFVTSHLEGHRAVGDVSISSRDVEGFIAISG
jgi:hypothetical protein